MFYRYKSTYAVFQQSVQNFGLKYLRNEIKRVRKLNVRNFNVQKFWQVMYQKRHLSPSDTLFQPTGMGRQTCLQLSYVRGNHDFLDMTMALQFYPVA